MNTTLGSSAQVDEEESDKRSSAFNLSYFVDVNESSEKRKLTLTGYLQDDFLERHNVLLLKTATIQFKFKFDG